MAKVEVEVFTFGCRLNHYESELIKKNVSGAGLEDVFIINSCAVTGEAERQLRQLIRKLKRQDPDKHIIVVGCAVQADCEQYANMSEVSYVLGNIEKLALKSYVKAKGVLSQGKRGAEVSDISKKPHCGDDCDIQMIEYYPKQARAFLRIQDGCDNYCSYCIVPQCRGKARSFPSDYIIKQAKIFVQNGHNEIVLTGVDVASYGQDLVERSSLGELSKQLLLHIPELKRLRLSSLDIAPMNRDEAFWDLLKNEPRFMPHLHLSLQSCDDFVLKRMKRRHDLRMMQEFCCKARELREDIVFGADFIAGFPGESEEHHKNTLEAINNLNIAHLHIFPYSERKGTFAAKVERQVPTVVRRRRAKELRELGEVLLRMHYETLIGQECVVMLEGGANARTEDFSLIKIQCDTDCRELLKVGALLKVEIGSFFKDCLTAIPII